MMVSLNPDPNKKNSIPKKPAEMPIELTGDLPSAGLGVPQVTACWRSAIPAVIPTLVSERPAARMKAY